MIFYLFTLTGPTTSNLRQAKVFENMNLTRKKKKPSKIRTYNAFLFNAEVTVTFDPLITCSNIITMIIENENILFLKSVV